jgi:hypothetical protein
LDAWRTALRNTFSIARCADVQVKNFACDVIGQLAPGCSRCSHCCRSFRPPSTMLPGRFGYW